MSSARHSRSCGACRTFRPAGRAPAEELWRPALARRRRVASARAARRHRLRAGRLQAAGLAVARIDRAGLLELGLPVTVLRRQLASVPRAGRRRARPSCRPAARLACGTYVRRCQAVRPARSAGPPRRPSRRGESPSPGRLGRVRAGGVAAPVAGATSRWPDWSRGHVRLIGAAWTATGRAASGRGSAARRRAVVPPAPRRWRCSPAAFAAAPCAGVRLAARGSTLLRRLAGDDGRRRRTVGQDDGDERIPDRARHDGRGPGAGGRAVAGADPAGGGELPDLRARPRAGAHPGAGPDQGGRRARSTPSSACSTPTWPTAIAAAAARGRRRAATTTSSRSTSSRPAPAPRRT